MNRLNVGTLIAGIMAALYLSKLGNINPWAILIWYIAGIIINIFNIIMESN
jgi:hypothetical protein